MKISNRVILVKQVLGSTTNSQIVDAEDFTIGRSPEALIQEAEPSVSRIHLRVYAKDESIYVVDLGSANGTFVNGKPINVNKPLLLKHNDYVVLGSGAHRYYIESVKFQTDRHKLLPKASPEEILEVNSIVELARQEAENFKKSTHALVKAEMDKAKAEALEIIKKAEQEALSLKAKIQAENIPEPEDNMDKTIIAPFSGVDVTHKIQEMIKAAEKEALTIIEAAKNRARVEEQKILETAKLNAKDMMQAAREQEQVLKKELESHQKALHETLENESERVRLKTEEGLKLAKEKADEIINEAKEEALEIKTAAEKIKEDSKLIWAKAEEALKTNSEKVRIQEIQIIEEAKREAVEIKSVAEKIKEESKILWAKAEETLKANNEKVRQQELQIIEDAKLEAHEILKSAKSQEAAVIKEIEDRAALLKLSHENEIKRLEARAQEIIQEARLEAAQIRQKAEQVKEEANQLFESQKSRGLAKMEEIIREGQKTADSIIEKAKNYVEDLKNSTLKQAYYQIEEEKSAASKKMSVILEQIKDREDELSTLDDKIQKQKEQHRASIKELENKIAINEDGLKEIEAKFNSQQSAWREAHQKYETTLAKTQELEARNDNLNEWFQSEEQKKFMITKEIEQLALTFEKQKEEFKSVKVNFEQDLADKRSKLEFEIESARIKEMGLIEGMKQAELQKVEELKKGQAASILQSKSELAKLLSTLVLDWISQHLTPEALPSNWKQFSDQFRKSTLEKIDEAVFSVMGTVDAHAMPQNAASKYLKGPYLKRAAIILVVLIGIALAIPDVRNYFENVFKGTNELGETPGQTYARKMKEDREKRKFTPTMTDEIKTNYTDNVIYTRSYSEIKTDKKMQTIWIKDLNRWAFEELKFNEEMIVKLAAAEASLIVQLTEKKAEIDPDFVDEGVKKMRKLEEETVAKIKEILGSPENYQRFLMYSNQYFLTKRDVLDMNAPKE